MPSIMVPYRWALVSGLIAKAIAQESGWKPNQVNATMCRWEHPRGEPHPPYRLVSILTRVVGVIRDTLYIDGGNLWYTPGMSNGQFGESTSDSMQAIFRMTISPDISRHARRTRV